MLVDSGVGNTPHHTTKTEVVHREEGEIEEDQRQEEMPLAKCLIEHAPEHLWEPEVECAEDGEDTTAKEHVVEVSDDKISVVNE